MVGDFTTFKASFFSSLSQKATNLVFPQLHISVPYWVAEFPFWARLEKEWRARRFTTKWTMIFVKFIQLYWASFIGSWNYLRWVASWSSFLFLTVVCFCTSVSHKNQNFLPSCYIRLKLKITPLEFYTSFSCSPSTV